MMTEYREAEAIVGICKKGEGIVKTVLEIEPFDNNSIFTHPPHAPASILTQGKKEDSWKFDLHKAISISKRRLTFITYGDFAVIPTIGERIIFDSGDDLIN
jgi:hypothetical protein